MVTGTRAASAARRLLAPCSPPLAAAGVRAVPDLQRIRAAAAVDRRLRQARAAQGAMAERVSLRMAAVEALATVAFIAAPGVAAIRKARRDPRAAVHSWGRAAGMRAGDSTPRPRLAARAVVRQGPRRMRQAGRRAA